MIPAIPAERWRLMESKLRQYEVDIQRLWRVVQDLQAAGTPGFSDALTPDDLAALSTVSGAGCFPGFELRHWYFPSGGSSEIEVTYNAVTETITIPYDASAMTVKSAIDAHSEMVAASVTCSASSSGTLTRSAVFVAMPEGGSIAWGDDTGLTADTSTGYVARLTVVQCGGCS